MMLLDVLLAVMFTVSLYVAVPFLHSLFVLDPLVNVKPPSCGSGKIMMSQICYLLDKDSQYHKIFHPQDLSPESPFRLLLKRSSKVRVGPKSTIDIPISFAPEEMRMYEAMCVVTVTNLDGSGWKYDIPLNE